VRQCAAVRRDGRSACHLLVCHFLWSRLERAGARGAGPEGSGMSMDRMATPPTAKAAASAPWGAGPALPSAACGALDGASAAAAACPPPPPPARVGVQRSSAQRVWVSCVEGL